MNASSARTVRDEGWISIDSLLASLAPVDKLQEVGIGLN
ncbi:Uncharacterised protein [Legionella cincinnatiensis]|uniref:Uncharacterized protein n=1 Tax=Legionella cincinnatiensis TaxID=28085 RepID=A0A378IHE4_9GAMM|nr:Uncharacterised protein [Legionella cincinnatiensis]STX34340.1 Uncharacterised protein [Legionella cincinnatiensis]